MIDQKHNKYQINLLNQSKAIEQKVYFSVKLCFFGFLSKIALFALIIQMSSSQIQSLHQAISGNLLTKSSEVHQHVKAFLQSEVKSIEAINKQNSKLQEQLKEKFGEYSKTLGDLKGKKYKDDRFIQGGAGFLQAKQKEIQGKKKLLQSINTGLKESVSKVEPKKLALLPFQKKPVFKDLFTTLQIVLFNEPADKFQWKTFKQKALIFEDGEDFLTRLANINFKDLSETNYDLIRQLKNDPRFAEVSENSENAVDVVDLADWVDYVCEGHKVHLEKIEIQRVYDKIRTDIAKRSDGSLNLKEGFCIQTRNDLDNYQNSIRVLQAELQNVVIQMNMSLQELKETETKRNSRIAEINAI